MRFKKNRKLFGIKKEYTEMNVIKVSKYSNKMKNSPNLLYCYNRCKESKYIFLFITITDFHSYLAIMMS